MEDIIPITRQGDRLVVSARDLHVFLKVPTPFRVWFPRVLKYGFEEDIDYTPYFLVHPQNNQQIRDFALVIDCAKEICMIQRTEKGKIARKYFIRKEKELREVQSSGSAAHAILQIGKFLVHQEEVNKQTAQRLKLLEAKTTTRVEAYTVAGYATKMDIKITRKQAATIGRGISRYCRDNGIEIEDTHDPRFGSVKVYPIEVLEKKFKDYLT